MSKQATSKVPNKVKVTERALMQRINRKLKPDYEQLRTARSEGVERDVGHYFIVDCFHNAITTQHVDLEKLGRKLGVLQKWEELADSEA